MKRGLLIAVSAILMVATAHAEPAPWTSIQDPEFGYSVTYPGALFHPAPDDRDFPSFRYLVSEGEEAKIAVGAWDKAEGGTPEALKHWLIKEAGAPEQLTYKPRGRSWFVLSGYHGDKIYYEKAMFTCGGRVVSLLAIVYPKSARQVYDPVVERMEDAFQPAHHCS